MPGACYCGAVRIEVDLPADEVGHCHCDNCRRAHGAGSVTYATFKPERFRLLAGEDNLTHHTSEIGSTRSFCSTCGSTLLYESPRWPGKTVMVANLLESLDQLPQAHVFADRAPAWFPITDDLPRLGGESGDQPLG